MERKVSSQNAAGEWVWQWADVEVDGCERLLNDEWLWTGSFNGVKVQALGANNHKAPLHWVIPAYEVRTHRMKHNDPDLGRHTYQHCERVARYWSQVEHVTNPDAAPLSGVHFHCQAHRGAARIAANSDR